MSKVVIIGAGASGLITAIYARKNHHEVLVLEKNDSLGKKILKTGNGKCNYWNSDQSIDHYHSRNKKILETIINDKNQKEVLSFFSSIGIVPKIKNGYYYPNSQQASSIKDALVLEAKLVGVEFLCDMEVIDLEKKDHQFVITTNQEKILADKVVLATGSYAGLKEKTNGYDLALKFKHTIIPVLPSLVQLKAEEKFLKDWSGIRSEAKIRLYENDKFIKEETGEIQLTDYGISGICTFNLSPIITRGLYDKKREHVIIDFLPIVNTKSIEDLISWIENRNLLVQNRNLFELFEGILNNKLVKVILNRCHMSQKKHWNNLNQKEKYEFAKNLKYFHLDIIGTNSYAKAQVCSGGIPLDEINPNTFESKKESHLYFVGEILDVDGECGGYNLSFAWISGMECGRNL